MIERTTAEQFLLDNEVIARVTPQTRQAIACVACRFVRARNRGESVKVDLVDLKDCTGLASGTVTPIMDRLETGGAVQGVMEEGDPSALGRPLRKSFIPAEGLVGVLPKARSARAV